MTPNFISVLGLSKRELPEDHYVSIDIPGICVGDGGVTVSNKECGTIVFMIAEPGIDKNRYIIYRDEVLLPFISRASPL